MTTSSKTILSIALIGPGLVGKEFIHQVQSFKHSKLSLRIVGLMSSKLMKIDVVNGITDISLKEAQDKKRFVTWCDVFICPACVGVCGSVETLSMYSNALLPLLAISMNFWLACSLQAIALWLIVLLLMRLQNHIHRS